MSRARSIGDWLTGQKRLGKRERTHLSELPQRHVPAPTPLSDAQGVAEAIRALAGPQQALPSLNSYRKSYSYTKPAPGTRRKRRRARNAQARASRKVNR
jgi:hypothetical protein